MTITFSKFAGLLSKIQQEIGINDIYIHHGLYPNGIQFSHTIGRADQGLPELITEGLHSENEEILKALNQPHINLETEIKNQYPCKIESLHEITLRLRMPIALHRNPALEALAIIKPDKNLKYPKDKDVFPPVKDLQPISNLTGKIKTALETFIPSQNEDGKEDHLLYFRYIENGLSIRLSPTTPNMHLASNQKIIRI
jgi:hypothetical protein